MEVLSFYCSKDFESNLQIISLCGILLSGPLAQSAEQLTLNQRVPGSSPGGFT